MNFDRRLMLGCLSLAILTWLATESCGQFMRGTDISALAVLEANGAQYSQSGQAGDAISILESNGVNWHRLRLFVDPVGADPIAVQDLAYTLLMAQRAKANGARLLLDLHYSDTWADPGKQFKPAGWSGLSFSQLEQRVYGYTRDVMYAFQAAGVSPEMIQIGNEVSNGMLWDDGRLWRAGVPESVEFDNLAALISAGIHGVRDATASGDQPRIMVHHDRGADWGTTSYYLDRLLPRLQQNGTDIDVVGYSYYPKWHYDPDSGVGGISDVQENLNNTVATYDKPVVIVETGFASRGTQFEPSYEFEVSPSGQADFLQAVVTAVQNVPNGMGQGVFWWYPEAVPLASVDVWEDGRYGLFNASGDLLPAIEVFSSLQPNPDFNDDGQLDCADIDALVAVIADESDAARFDLSEDGRVDLVDRDTWLELAGRENLGTGTAYLLGDANLDGSVDGQDFLVWNRHKFGDTAAWCAADFSADGVTDGQDFLAWNGNKFRSSDSITTVPAPYAGRATVPVGFGSDDPTLVNEVVASKQIRSPSRRRPVPGEGVNTSLPSGSG